MREGTRIATWGNYLPGLMAKPGVAIPSTLEKRGALLAPLQPQNVRSVGVWKETL